MAGGPAADRQGSAWPRGGCSVRPHRGAAAADADGGPGRGQRLPVLRGRLWAEVYVKDERVIQIEGDPDSPVSRGRLCPKGSASEQLVNSPSRHTAVLYRAPHATQWTELDVETATRMVADRVLETRERTWQERDGQGNLLRRTLGFASLGGATLDNEENYLMKKVYTALGAIQVENQARI